MNPLREWFPIIGWMRQWQRGDRMLSLSVAPVPMSRGGEYVVMALEYPADVEPAQVLDHHAHELLGKRKSETAAKRLAERYAEKWQGMRILKEAARCDCEEIGAVAP